MFNLNWKPVRQILPTALLLLGSRGLVHASYVQLTSASQLSATDALATYGQPDSSKLASPFSESAGGNTVTFATGTNAAFTVQHQGVSFFGDFAPGTPLLYNGGSGPDVVSFAMSVNEFGVVIESNVIASHLYTITLFSGAVADFTYAITDGGFNSFFAGTRGTGASTFDHVTIASDDNDFAIGPVSFSVSSIDVPEPSSSLLFFAGLLALAWLANLARRTA